MFYLLDSAKLFKFGNQKTLKNLKLLQEKKLIKIDQILNGKQKIKENYKNYKYWRRRIKELKPRILVLGVGGAGETLLTL